MSTINLQLPERLAQFVQSQAQVEGLASAEAYVESVLTREQRKRTDIAQLDGELEQGVASGKPSEVNDHFWEQKRHELLKRFRH